MLKWKSTMPDLLWSDMYNSSSIGLTSAYIEKFLQMYCRNFHGIFSPDTLPIQTVGPGTLVCNLSNSDLPGSHFISIIIRDSEVLYIDPFGTPCENELISNFMKLMKKPIKYNSSMVQALSSSFCGFFCILFCLYYDQKRSFQLMFYEDLRKNDLKCVQLIQMLTNENKI